MAKNTYVWKGVLPFKDWNSKFVFAEYSSLLGGLDG